MNHLEQVVGEWYEYNGYFVRRNIKVGKRRQGGYGGELDIVAFNPLTKHLVHVEPSLDAHSWTKREERYAKKFAAGRKYIPELFEGLAAVGEDIDQIALFLFGSKANVKSIAGGRVETAFDFFSEITADLKNKKAAQQAVPEQFPLLRTIQFSLEFGGGSPPIGMDRFIR